MRERPGATLDRYFEGLGAARLLEPEEEVALARAMEAGRAAAARLESVPPPCREERARLAAQVEAGEAARSRFVVANLRLVVSLAAKQPRTPGVGLDDLVQDGNVGLLQAVDRFDWRRGYRFSTYAIWWIRQALQRGMSADDRTIRLPYALSDAARRVRAASARLEAETGCQPSVAALAEATNLDDEAVRRALEIPPDATSLDRRLGDGEGDDLGSVVAVADDDPAEDVAARLAAAQQLRMAADAVDDRSWRILVLRYGLDGRVPRTYDAIGAELGLSRETVRVSINRALDAIRGAIPASAA